MLQSALQKVKKTQIFIHTKLIYSVKKSCLFYMYAELRFSEWKGWYKLLEDKQSITILNYQYVFKIFVHFRWQVFEELILITCSIEMMFTTSVTEDIIHSCTKLWVMPIYQITFTGMDVQSHSGQTLLWPLWWRMLLLIKVQTTPNHFCYTWSIRDDLEPNISPSGPAT